MDRWQGKVALVTGASSGIGEAIARKLSQHGMHVVACARSLDKLEKISQEEKNILPIRCDVREESEILDMFKVIKEKFGVVHVCVNNAGIVTEAGGQILKGGMQEWRDMFNVNVLALCICTRESVKLMKENGVDDGHVININSVAGHRVENKAIYTGTKYAVTSLSEGLRRELMDTHIRSTSISPGFVHTPIFYKYFKDEPEKADKLYSSLKCLDPEDIADATVYALCAPKHVNVNELTIRATEEQRI